MKSRNSRKLSPASLLPAVKFLVFGFCWTLASFSAVDEVPFGLGFIFPAIGIIFVLVGAIKAVRYFRGDAGNIIDDLDAPPDSWIRDETRNDDGKQQNRR